MNRTIFDEEHELFRSAFRQFVAKEMVPKNDRWERDGLVDKDLFIKAGRRGFVGINVPHEFGGGGVNDFRFNAIVSEELQKACLAGAGGGITLHNDVCTPYFLRYATPEQKSRWLPGIASGELVTAIAMSEPGTGSDLAAISTRAALQGDYYLVNGSKTFISNGINADLIICAVRTDTDDRHRGLSLLVIEANTEGFERGRNLDKIGMRSQDTAELFFGDAIVPADNLLGEEGRGFEYLVSNLPQERLTTAVQAVAAARAAYEMTLNYATQRTAFGTPIGSFQHNKFWFAEMVTEITIAETFIDLCITSLNASELTPEEAAMAKWWTTELQVKVVDRCLQLHGGYGYMEEYPIARVWRDSRIQTIYAGSTQIMKELIGRSLGL